MSSMVSGGYITHVTLDNPTGKNVGLFPKAIIVQEDNFRLFLNSVPLTYVILPATKLMMFPMRGDLWDTLYNKTDPGVYSLYCTSHRFIHRSTLMKGLSFSMHCNSIPDPAVYP